MSNSTLSNSIRLLLLTCVVATTTNISAQPIGVWNFTGNTNGSAGSFNTVGNASFVGVASTAFNAGNEYYGQNNWPTATTPNPGVYFQFSLTPNAGYSLNISSLVLRMRRSNTGTPSGSGPRAWSLRSSVDGYAADIASGTITHNYANYTVNPGFVFATLTSSVTFRLYGYNASVGAGGNSRLVFDNITVNGLGNPLPVHIISFAASEQNNGVRIQYKLGQTDPGDRYLVERSVDGSNFTAIDNRLQSSVRDYEEFDFFDNALPAGFTRLFYRLAIRTASGAMRYSDIAIVSITTPEAALAVSISGNMLLVTGDIPALSHLSIVSASGAQLYQTRLAMSGRVRTSIPIPRLLPGVYYVTIYHPNGRKTVSLRVD